MENIKDKVCFITGGAGGIGKAISLHLLEKGAKVFEMSLSRKLSDEITRQNLHSFRGDVSQEKDVMQPSPSAWRHSKQ